MNKTFHTIGPIKFDPACVFVNTCTIVLRSAYGNPIVGLTYAKFIVFTYSNTIAHEINPSGSAISTFDHASIGSHVENPIDRIDFAQIGMYIYSTVVITTLKSTTSVLATTQRPISYLSKTGALVIRAVGINTASNHVELIGTVYPKSPNPTSGRWDSNQGKSLAFICRFMNPVRIGKIDI